MSLKRRVQRKIRSAYEGGKRIVRAAKPLLGAVLPYGGALASLGGDAARAQAANLMSRQVKKQAGGGQIDYTETYWG